MPKQSKAEKLADARIERAYYARCQRVQINIMDIPKVFKEGQRLVAAGADDVALGDGIAAFVATIAV